MQPSKPSPSINSDTLKAMIILDKNKNPSSIGKQQMKFYMTRNIVMKQIKSQASLQAEAKASRAKSTPATKRELSQA